EMRKHVDTMVVVPNERLLAVVGKGIPFQDALKKADEVLLHATQGISSLITVTGIVNVDFADVRTVMQNGGAAIMGTGMGRGENRGRGPAAAAVPRARRRGVGRASRVREAGRAAGPAHPRRQPAAPDGAERAGDPHVHPPADGLMPSSWRASHSIVAGMLVAG